MILEDLKPTSTYVYIALGKQKVDNILNYIGMGYNHSQFGNRDRYISLHTLRVNLDDIRPCSLRELCDSISAGYSRTKDIRLQKMPPGIRTVSTISSAHKAIGTAVAAVQTKDTRENEVHDLGWIIEVTDLIASESDIIRYTLGHIDYLSQLPQPSVKLQQALVKKIPMAICLLKNPDPSVVAMVSPKLANAKKIDTLDDYQEVYHDLPLTAPQTIQATKTYSAKIGKLTELYGVKWESFDGTMFLQHTVPGYL